MAEEPHENVSLRNLWRFLAQAFPYWGWLSLGVVAGLGRMVLSLLLPWLLATVIDDVGTPYIAGELEPDAAIRRLGWLAALFGGVMVLHAVSTIGRVYCPSRAAANAVRDVRVRLFRHIQRLHLAFHSERPTGSIVARVMSDVDSAQYAMDVIFIQLSQNIMISGVILAVMFTTDWQWTLVALATMPIFLITTRVVSRPMRGATRRQRESIADMTGLVQERFAMIREVQAFTAEENEERRVRDEAEQLRAHTIRQRLLASVVLMAAELTRYLALGIVLGFGAWQIVRGEGSATLGALPMFFLYTQRLLDPLGFFAELYTQVQVAAASADRIFAFLDEGPKIVNAPDAKDLRISGPPEVRFDAVRFTYPGGDAPALDGLSLVVPGGSTCVLVGGSGAGKSTLLSLVPRFYDPDPPTTPRGPGGGRVLIDGQDIRDVKLESLRANVGLVPQEAVLFGGTLEENIRYGRPNASAAEVRRAVEQANAAAFIDAMPAGLATVIGERGARLSGGQKQRIAIARAFLRDPPILILDEATSNLDAHSEAVVLEAMERLARGRTTLIIAHRLSVARSADLIAVLNGGRLIEQGSHHHLLDNGGAYASLWASQAGEAAGR